MSSTPSSPSTSSTADHDAKDIVSYGTGPSELEKSRDESLTLIDAMRFTDIIRETFRKRNDPREAESMVPPGTLQGVTAFAATGLLMTPFRRSILNMTGTRGPFQGFVDLVITPMFAVGAAQVGLVIGTLYGSSHYLDRLAMDAATTTMSSSPGSNELMSVRFGRDDGKSYSRTTESLATARESTVTELCQELLSLSSSPPSSEASIQTGPLQNTTALEARTPSFGSWDPRSTTMKSLLHALDNCRRLEN